MKFLKSTDKKLEEIGFKKVNENSYRVSYEKYIAEYGYIHAIDIVHKQTGNHLILSYEKGINKSELNNSVGLTGYETKLILKKMKEINFI